ncbi:MAG: tRNA pseudouridine(38-40) synthase TruA [Granulosicoccaceae bacterium]
MRIALAVEYNGQPFCGWQRQPHCHSVQAELEQALSAIAQEPIVVQCAGRTDTGVHALAQIVHFDTAVVRPLRAWTFGVNTHLSRAVSVHWAAEAHPEFHARFKALDRRYRYTIFNRATRTGLYADHTSWVNMPLDADAMHAATAALIGEHDFSAFRSAECQANHARRTIREFSVKRDGQQLYIDIVANGFLHNMVRILSGCLIKIGKHEEPAEWLGQLLQLGDRRLAGMTAPPQGLCFIQPSYPAEYSIPDFQIDKAC